MDPPVFISHSSADRDVAARLCAALERRGVECWLASRDIGPGENFQEAIVRAIRSARVMVLAFTSNANNSSEIKKELALASQNRLVVIPLRAEDVLPSDAFLYEFSTRQWIDAFDDWDSAIGSLTDQIRGIIGEQKADSGVSPTVPGHGRHAAVAPRRRLTLPALAALALALVVAGGLAYRIVGDRIAPASVTNHAISGTWVSGTLTNPYDRKQKSVLEFDFQQSGETLFGTVSENTDFGRSRKGIQGGQVKGDVVVFYTQGVTTSGTDEQPYKEHYHGTVMEDEIAFVRQNDVPSGGLPENFTARRKKSE